MRTWKKIALCAVAYAALGACSEETQNASDTSGRSVESGPSGEGGSVSQTGGAGATGGGGSAAVGTPGVADAGTVSAEVAIGDYAAEHSVVLPTEPPTSVAAPQVNPFVLAANDAFSTFAADVDTASYDIFRRSLQGGYLPEPGLVRTEEFINYFQYNYEVPDLEDPEPFTITLDAVSGVADRTTHLVRVGIQGAMPRERSAANLVFLVDVSGSMSSENKLPLVKTVLREALDVLSPTDTVSIVTYASDTRVRLAPTPVSEQGEIVAVIDALTAGGSTAGASGIQLAYEQAEAGFTEDGINHVFLCTDGDFNVGISDPDALVELIEEERRSGVTLTALGFGERNNDEMMERVSNAGNGIYSVIYNEDQAISYATGRLLSSMIHIAKDMKLQVEFNPELVLAYRLIGYENRAVADIDFRNDSVDGGEVGAGHRVTALYEIVLADEDLPEAAGDASEGDEPDPELVAEIAEDELLRVKVRYKQPGAPDTAEASEVYRALSPSDVAESPSAADGDAQWAMAVALFAELLRHSPYSDIGTAPELIELLEANQGDDVERREFVVLAGEAAALLADE